MGSEMCIRYRLTAGERDEVARRVREAASAVRLFGARGADLAAPSAEEAADASAGAAWRRRAPQRKPLLSTEQLATAARLRDATRDGRAMVVAPRARARERAGVLPPWEGEEQGHGQGLSRCSSHRLSSSALLGTTTASFSSGAGASIAA